MTEPLSAGSILFEPGEQMKTYLVIDEQTGQLDKGDDLTWDDAAEAFFKSYEFLLEEAKKQQFELGRAQGLEEAASQVDILFYGGDPHEAWIYASKKIRALKATAKDVP